MSTDAAASGAGHHDAPRSKRSDAGSLWLPRWAWVVLILWVALVTFVRSQDGIDRAIVNILTLVLTFFSALSIFIWFCAFSGYSRWLRIGLLTLTVGTIAVLVASFKIVSVSGELIPTWDYRWAKAPDAALATVAPRDVAAAPAGEKKSGDAPSDETMKDSVTPAPAGIDLVTTTPNDFPQFLGPQRSCWIPDPGLATDWAARPPSLVWKQPIGPVGRRSAW